MRRAVCGLMLVVYTATWAQSVHPVTGRHYAGVMGWRRGLAGAAGARSGGAAGRSARRTRDREGRDGGGYRRGRRVHDVAAGGAGRAGGQGVRQRYSAGDAGDAAKNMEQRKIANVETVLGTVDDPKLPSDSVDLVLLVDVYHEFSEPQEMLRRIRESLRKDGRLVLLEYRAEDLRCRSGRNTR